jgi:hypothetical protein
MNKGMIPVLVTLLCLLLPLNAAAEGQIYKIVNPDGSVTFTDQKPAPGAEPVKLRPLSVVETDSPAPAVTEPASGAAEEAEKEPTARELRRQFSDFGITQPRNEETFWGTANQVTVSWGASQPTPEGMSAVLYVNGEARDVPASGSVALTLDRGEHRVSVELRDSRKRRVVASDPVVFFVKQHSVNFN